MQNHNRLLRVRRGRLMHLMTTWFAHSIHRLDADDAHAPQLFHRRSNLNFRGARIHQKRINISSLNKVRRLFSVVRLENDVVDAQRV